MMRRFTPLFLLLLLAAPVAHAAVDPPSTDGWGSFFAYAACALGIAGASTGFGAAAAAVGCAALFLRKIQEITE